MPVPDFVLKLRERIGHDLLMLPGISMLVFNDAGDALLLQRRADNGRWVIPGGIPEPGESMTDAVAREMREEAGIAVEVVKLIGVFTEKPIQYANGDRAQYVTIAFRCRIVEGEPHVADEESLEMRFFPLAALPPLREDHAARVAQATSGRAEAFFDPPARQSGRGGLE